MGMYLHYYSTPTALSTGCRMIAVLSLEYVIEMIVA